jgi:hypothetical protein
MMDALAICHAKGLVNPVTRSSDKPGATGFVLGAGRLSPAAPDKATAPTLSGASVGQGDKL